MASGVPEPAQTGLLPALAALAGTLLGSVGLWLANRLLGKAAFQTAINQGFSELTKDLQAERAALRAELANARVQWDGERASLKGEIRNLMQTIESLKSELRRRGVPIAPDPIGANEPEAGASILPGDPS